MLCSSSSSSMMYDDLIPFLQQNICCSELDIFYGKHMSFKVEVAEGNLIHNWRSYVVKRITDDVDMIKRFMVFHNVKSITDDDDAVYDENVVTLSNSVPTQFEGVDSSKSVVNQKDTDVIQVNDCEEEDEQTPCSKVV
ncbi:uncharacterized protein [Medicago truncatula]|uniref:uncharacterized protein n=1 Tax=Medicago truncatula TaxID=3880 RepID=UPI0019679B4C|nr:uncharacterized protein LOC120575895 [Medicago truncatula]